MSGTPFRRPNAGFITAGSTIYVPVFTDGVDRGAVFAEGLPQNRFAELHTDQQVIFHTGATSTDIAYFIRLTCTPGEGTTYTLVGSVLS